MTQNTASSGPASLWSTHTRATIVNTIAWPPTGQEAMRFQGPDRPRLGTSIVPGGIPANAEDLGGVRDEDPLFFDPVGQDGVPGTEDDDLGLMATSPAINAGDNSFIPPDFADLDGDGDRLEPTPFDLAGNQRVQGSQVDIGAYEAPGSTSIGVPDLPLVGSECSLDIFPSPFSDDVTVMLASRRPTTLNVFGTTGRRVTQHIVAAGSRSIKHDTSDWPKGVFLFSLRVASGSCTGVAVHG